MTTPNPPSINANVLPILANGQYEVGCADIMLSDPPTSISADEEEQQQQQQSVGVFARVFYPAAPSSGSTTTTPSPSNQLMRWRPDAEYIKGLASYQGMSVAKLNLFLDWMVGDKKTPVRWHAPVLSGEQRFPLIIFSHGISGNRFVYTTVCATMASHGYVVAALEHRDGSSCWTYSLEPVPQPMPSPSPPSATEEQKIQNGGVNLAENQQQQQTSAPPPKAPTPPPPTHVKKPIQMRILPHDETEYDVRIVQVKKRVAETAQMRRLFELMDENGLKNGQENGTIGGQQQQIVDGQAFDWTQFKDRLALDRCLCMGHSFGAASSLTACAEHPSLFHACVLLDAWLYPVESQIYTTIGQPVLMLNASKWQWARNVRRMHQLLAPAFNNDMTPISNNTTETTVTNATSMTGSSDTTEATVTDATSMSSDTTETTVTDATSMSSDTTETTVANSTSVSSSSDTTETTTAPAQNSNNTNKGITSTKRVNTDTRMLFTIKDIVHQSFSDFGFLVPGRVARFFSIQGDLDPLLTGTAFMEMVLAFSENFSNSSALERLRRLVAEKYATFVLEGTEIPQEQLDEVP